MLSVPVCVRPSVRHGSAGREAGRTAVSDDHARPRTTDRARPGTTAAHDRARPRTTTTHDRSTRPRTTAHDRARPPRTTTHDRARPRTTTHDHARSTTAAIFVWGSGTYPTPGGFWSFRGLNCLARLALARERTPSIIKIERQNFRTGPRIEPKFGTHVRIDTLTLKTLKKWTRAISWYSFCVGQDIYRLFSIIETILDNYQQVWTG